MRFKISIVIFFLISLIISGCSGAGLPVTPGLSTPNGQSMAGDNPFKDFPVDKPYDSYTIVGDSFKIDASGNVNRNISVNNGANLKPTIQLLSSNLDKADSIAIFDLQMQNGNETIYDAHLVLDRVLPQSSEPLNIDGLTPDGKAFWNFGIIPSGKTSPTRELNIKLSSLSGISVTGHIEYKNRAYVLQGDSILHTVGYDDKCTKANMEFGEIVSNEVIAGVPEGYTISDVYDYLVQKHLMIVGYISDLKCMELRILNDRVPEDVIQNLKLDSILSHPEPNPIIKADYFPNDPVYDPAQTDDKRWAFQRVKAIEAWDVYSDGIINQSGNANVAFGTILAILDTGLVKHLDFNLDNNDKWIIDNLGRNFIDPLQPTNTLDDNGHGTRVAGIAGAQGNNSLGIAGMAWNPIFLPVKVLNSNGRASGYSVQLGLVYVRNLASQYPWAKVVVNMSLGAYSQSIPTNYMKEATDYANGVPNTILVAAAGNDKNDKNFYNSYNDPDINFEINADNHYPSAFDACISVGASSRTQESDLDIEVNDSGTGSWGTNWGNTVDVCAPGTNVWTTDKYPTMPYYDFGGTSASTPFISGAAALIWSKYPSYTKEQVRNAILDNCDPMQTHGKALGHGRLNAYRIFGGDIFNPVIVKRVDMADVALDVYVSGSYAYIADSVPGLQIVDISIPEQAYIAKWVGLPGYAWGVCVNGNSAYVADGKSGLQVVDITDPLTAHREWEVIPTGAGYYSHNVFVSGNYAYLADDDPGLAIISLPSRQIEFTVETNAAHDVYVVNNYAYVADDASGMQIVNLQQKQIVKTVGSNWAYGVFVHGDKAYIADVVEGLISINIIPPENAYRVGQPVNTPGTTRGIFILGKYIYIADGEAGLQIMNLDTMQIVSSVDTPGYAFNVYVVGDYAYIADEEGDLEIVKLR